MRFTSPAQEEKKAGEYNVCENLFYRPRLHVDICRWHIEKGDKMCDKCPAAKRIRGE